MSEVWNLIPLFYLWLSGEWIVQKFGAYTNVSNPSFEEWRRVGTWHHNRGLYHIDLWITTFLLGSRKLPTYEVFGGKSHAEGLEMEKAFILQWSSNGCWWWRWPGVGGSDLYLELITGNTSEEDLGVKPVTADSVNWRDYQYYSICVSPHSYTTDKTSALW